MRAQLANPEAFDRDARAYFTLQPMLFKLLRQIDFATDNVTNMTDRSGIARCYRRRLAFLAGVSPPEQWTECDACSGTSRKHGASCTACEGQGYSVTQPESGRFVPPAI